MPVFEERVQWSNTRWINLIVASRIHNFDEASSGVVVNMVVMPTSNTILFA